MTLHKGAGHVSVWAFTILWYLFCIGITVDTKLFVYLSLSQTLIGGVLLLVLVACTILHQVRNHEYFRISPIQYFVLAWMVYLLIHALFIQEAEVYKLLYLEETLMLLLVLSNLLKSKMLSWRGLENGILLMDAIQMCGLSLQTLGLLNTYNSNFSLTGFSENPNVTAILLAVCLPILYKRMKESSRRYLWLSFILLSILFIIILKCRTAYIFIAIIMAMRIASSESVRNFWKGSLRFGKSAIIYSAILGVIISGLVLYKSKQASADGRLLVWKVSAMLIQEHPQGVGIGMFEHDYNLRQGEYFGSMASTDVERNNSGTVYMAYNDFLEQGVESGWIGLFFMLGLYAFLIRPAYKQRDYATMSIIGGFFVMANINFIYASIQPWIVFICYASLILSRQPESMPVMNISRSFFRKGIIPVSAVVCCIFLYHHGDLLYSQILLKQLTDKSEQGRLIDMHKAESLSYHIGTSEAYYRFMAGQYRSRDDYESALNSLQLASEYTSSPDLYFSIFDCYDRMGKPSEGIPYIQLIRKMLPQNLTSRLVLLNWYDHESDLPESNKIANEIIHISPKIRTGRSDEIQSYAKNYILQHNTFINSISQ